MSTRKNPPDQLTAEEVARLTKQRKYAEIEQHRIDGHLDVLLGIDRHRPPVDAQWTAADVTAMHSAGRFDEINRARAAGQLDNLFGIDPDAA
jgi:hypothetical protein